MVRAHSSRTLLSLEADAALRASDTLHDRFIRPRHVADPPQFRCPDPFRLHWDSTLHAFKIYMSIQTASDRLSRCNMFYWFAFVLLALSSAYRAGFQ
jgi:hypothetical protein